MDLGGDDGADARRLGDLLLVGGEQRVYRAKALGKVAPVHLADALNPQSEEHPRERAPARLFQ